MLGYAEARRRKTKSTDAKPRAESSLLGYAEARRRKTAKEEDEVNRRHAGRHELFPMAGAGGE